MIVHIPAIGVILLTVSTIVGGNFSVCQQTAYSKLKFVLYFYCVSVESTCTTVSCFWGPDPHWSSAAGPCWDVLYPRSPDCTPIINSWLPLSVTIILSNFTKVTVCLFFVPTSSPSSAVMTIQCIYTHSLGGSTALMPLWLPYRHTDTHERTAFDRLHC